MWQQDLGETKMMERAWLPWVEPKVLLRRLETSVGRVFSHLVQLRDPIAGSGVLETEGVGGREGV